MPAVNRHPLLGHGMGPVCSCLSVGLTENAGRENDGPSKLQGVILRDMKLMDQCAGHEIAGHESDGPICRA